MIFAGVRLWCHGLLFITSFTPVKENKNTDWGKKNIWLGGKLLSVFTTVIWGKHSSFFCIGFSDYIYFLSSRSDFIICLNSAQWHLNFPWGLCLASIHVLWQWFFERHSGWTDGLHLHYFGIVYFKVSLVNKKENIGS